MRSRATAVAIATALAITFAVAGCGSSNSTVSVPAIGAAKIFRLSGFTPTGIVTADHPVTVSFTVLQPDGKPLTQYKTGSGPHTGVHLIIVRDDLHYIIHHHPPVTPSGRLTDSVTFPAPGPYRVLIDLYPNLPGVIPNFQLLGTVNVAGPYHPAPLPKFSATQTVDGTTFTMQPHPPLHAIQAQFLNINVRTATGGKLNFVPWFGALAHAIFFHAGSLDYFHTHVCGKGAANCTSVLGATKVTGSATPGRLTIGVLLAVPGTWELFLQMLIHGQVVSVPYTLSVGS